MLYVIVGPISVIWRKILNLALGTIKELRFDVSILILIAMLRLLFFEFVA